MLGKFKYVVLVSSFMIMILGLVGCSDASSDTSINNQVKNEENTAKKDIMERFENVVNEYTIKTKEDRELTADEYYSIADDINIISNSINSLAAIQMNSPVQFDEQIELLRKDLDVVTDEIAEEALILMYSTKLIYDTTVREIVGNLEKRIQINGDKNLLTRFIDTDFDSNEEAIIAATEYIENINSAGTGDYYYIEHVNNRIKDVRKKVSDDGFKYLDTITGLLESSLEKQENILESIVDPLSDVNVDEEFQSALKDYEKAKQLLDSFEGK